jgi:TonB family protein
MLSFTSERASQRFHPSAPTYHVLSGNAWGCIRFGAGCRHANVPTLPASHGHLALALDKYLELPTQKPSALRPVGALELMVALAQAPSVFAEAVQVLQGKPTEDEVHQAAEDLTAACEASFQPACDFLREQFKAPTKVAGDLPEYPQEALRLQAPAVAVLRCRLGVDGRLRTCEVVEAAPYGFTEALLKAVLAQQFQPAMLAGHPFEIPYTVWGKLTPTTRKPTPEQYLQWTRKRAEAFPKSVAAWFDLASMLAQQAPEDPAYVLALRHLHDINPHYWWSANELAWMHAQAGQYAEAALLARRARNEAPRNPYVLEVSAATLLGLGPCLDAVSMQRQAVEGIPDEWPRPERERFLSTLREYTQRCAAGAATTPVAPVR